MILLLFKLICSREVRNIYITTLEWRFARFSQILWFNSHSFLGPFLKANQAVVFIPRKMPVNFSSYRLGPGQRASFETVPPLWDWLLWRQNELGPWRSKSRITFTVLVPPTLVSVKRLALIVTVFIS